jgi:hypothetical protein
LTAVAFEDHGFYVSCSCCLLREVVIFLIASLLIYARHTPFGFFEKNKPFVLNYKMF